MTRSLLREPGMNIGRSIGIAVVAVTLLGMTPAGCGGGDDLDPDGCDAENPCEDGGRCYIPRDVCEPEATGTCVTGFTNCDGPASGPQCGCDGQVIEGPYGACGTEQRTASRERCAQGTFTCGDKQCTRHVNVCVATSGGPAGSETVYECVDALSVPYCLSGIAACDCLNLEDLGCSDSSCCSSDADNQETISIQLP